MLSDGIARDVVILTYYTCLYVCGQCVRVCACVCVCVCVWGGLETDPGS